MKSFTKGILFLLSSYAGTDQETTVVLTPSMEDPGTSYISPGDNYGGIFKGGDDTASARRGVWWR